MVNLQLHIRIYYSAEDLYDIVLKEAKEWNNEIDKYYLEKIHSKYSTYIINPPLITQRDSYSDIEQKNISYDFMRKKFLPKYNQVKANFHR